MKPNRGGKRKGAGRKPRSTPRTANEAAKKAAKTKNSRVLFRGLENPMNKDYDNSKRDSPQGYSTWTDNPLLAREYAGKNGFVYMFSVPVSDIKSNYIDEDGERALAYPSQKKAGINNVRGKEFLVYEDHESFDFSQIKCADPVTYDEAGNVIPLSQRFN